MKEEKIPKIKRRRIGGFRYRQKVYSHFSPDLVDELDRLADALCTSRSHLIELICSVGLSECHEKFSDAIRERLKNRGNF